MTRIENAITTKRAARKPKASALPQTEPAAAAPAVSAQPAAPSTESRPVPDWVTETPDETTYCLTMFDGSGGQSESVELVRAEYIALKTYLAVARGYLTKMEANELMLQPETGDAFIAF